MLKFFRKIRQQLISENKTGKYLKYAIGEIVLVVIGILIAVQINSFYNKKSADSMNNKLLSRMIEEAKLNIERLNYLMFDGSGGGDIMTKQKFENFELTFSWKVTEGANSGVMYRVTTGDGAPYFSGPEYQILDDSKHRDGKNKLTSSASLYALYIPEGKTEKPVGQWNLAKIVIKGQNVEHWLNGKQVVSAEIGSDDWKERVNNSKFKSWKKFAASKVGHICFQDHGDKVWFKDIRVTKLAE